MKGTAGMMEDGIRIQNGIGNMEMWCVRSWELFRESKFDVHSKMVYFTET